MAAVTDCIIQAAAQCIPKTLTRFPLYSCPWWNPACHMVWKAQKWTWDTFCRCSTLSHSITFHQACACARWVRRQSQKESRIKFTTDISSTTSSRVKWDKIRKVSEQYNSVPISIFFSDGQEVVDTQSIADTLGESFYQVSRISAAFSTFLAIKTQAERSPLSFQADCLYDYNRPFILVEFKLALHRSGSTSVGPDKVHYEMLHHLSPASLSILLIGFNWIWQENVFPDAWCQSIVLPFSKLGKDLKIPSNYRPISLMNCL
ncbi:uncharacterized protein LOC143224724 isoform X1 [Tachypleus tridentatus]|uniref:uncharacterized protein LOC143224724 isoform X1 n=1 Tax=Tachypleus tridentatus TaxID=6853 RepID=UPI003FD31BFD